MTYLDYLCSELVANTEGSWLLMGICILTALSGTLFSDIFRINLLWFWTADFDLRKDFEIFHLPALFLTVAQMYADRDSTSLEIGSCDSNLPLVTI